MSCNLGNMNNKVCVNGLCGTTKTSQWKRGWAMRIGGFASLCFTCGTEYDNVRYCERYHLNEAGWRECKFCDKPIHCGCIVSKYLYECLDTGGVACITCVRSKGTQPFLPSLGNKIPNGVTRFSGNWHPSVFTNRMNTSKLTPLTEGLKKSQPTSWTSSIGQPFRQDEKSPSLKEFGSHCSSSKDINSSFQNFSTPLPTRPDNNNLSLGSESMYESLHQQSLGRPLRNPSSSLVPTSNGAVDGRVQENLTSQYVGFSLGNSSSSLGSNSNGVIEGRVQENVPSFKQEQKPHQLVMKLSKSGAGMRSQSNKGKTGSDNRVGRPPGVGRGHSQLLPRYWPRITDQELLQICGDLKSDCSVTPLFEKVLSASDVGKIGRLVLPKACAEAYFPLITQSEGVPVKLRDIKGKEWTVQFRFWPNNNSRMYVLEGVSPCIQNLRVEAGDTVIFSRLDPGDKLIIGCRKASTSAEASALPNHVNEESQIVSAAKNMDEGTNNLDSVQKAVIQEEKKTRNIGSKSKRLHMHSEEAMELKFTWEEAQDFLRPPSSKPTVVMIENCELEEYNEPPVFGKKIIFTTTASRLQEQLIQCDSCSKWRKLPSDVLIPSKWTCSDNVSDPSRSSCSAPEEIGVADLDQILKSGKESKKRKTVEDRVTKEEEKEPTGLDALATVAVLGAKNSENGGFIAGPTTRHPRHRPGCSCIVCIQPPSGKGKHKPNCICNVCLTVRRRFKTMMQRKKKRLLDEEAERVKSRVPANKKTKTGGGVRNGIAPEMITESSNKGQELDLNSDPKEESMMLAASSILPEWKNVPGGRVPNGISDLKRGPVQINGVEGS